MFLVEKISECKIRAYLFLVTLFQLAIGFWMRYHLFWTKRLGLDAIPDSVFESGLPWQFFAQVDPRRNNFGKNLIRNGATELVSAEVL